jgi:hypothetical protein
MKALVVSILLYSCTLWANSFEVEAIHLVNGNRISIVNESQEFLTEEVRAVEIVNENQEHILVTPRLFNKLINGGDAGGGFPMSVRGAVRIGGDGSGGG